jgi:hypothetical protein
VVIGHVFLLTWHDARTYPGIDLRAKVVGARRLVKGLDPYYDPRLELPPDPLRMISVNTYSPALLVLYVPLRNLSWNEQRLTYFAFDWLAVMLCFALLAGVFPAEASTATLCFCFALLIIGDYSFRIHLERGQYYVGLSLLAALASVFIRRRDDSWIYAAPLALLILLRPTYAISAVGFYIWGRRRYAMRAVVVLCVLILLLLPLTGIKVWKSYFASIQNVQKKALMAFDGMAPRGEALAANVSTIEGVDFSKRMDLHGYEADRTFIGFANGSVRTKFTDPLVNWLGRRSSRAIATMNLVGLLSMAALSLTIMFGLGKCPQTSLIPIAFAFLMPMNLEFFGPQRFAYADVTVLVPLMLVLAAVLGNKGAGGPVLVGTLLGFGAALPWLALHLNTHVQLASVVKYVSTVAILNIVCARQAWTAWREKESVPAVAES